MNRGGRDLLEGERRGLGGGALLGSGVLSRPTSSSTPGTAPTAGSISALGPGFTLFSARLLCRLFGLFGLGLIRERSLPGATRGSRLLFSLVLDGPRRFLDSDTRKIQAFFLVFSDLEQFILRRETAHGLEGRRRKSTRGNHEIGPSQSHRRFRARKEIVLRESQVLKTVDEAPQTGDREFLSDGSGDWSPVLPEPHEIDGFLV